MIRTLALALLLALGTTARAPAQEVEAGLSLRGRVRAVDGGAVAGAEARARCGPHGASATLDSVGRFWLSLPCPDAAASLELVDHGGRYLPARHELSAGGWRGERAFLLVPAVWTIATGSHAGARVPVNLRGATTPACRSGCSAFYTREDTTAGRPPGIPVWLEHSLPLRLAFSADDGVQIPEADSIAFMRAAEELEADLGRRWFQPARYEQIFEVGPEDRFGSLVVSIDPLLRDAGRGNWAAQGGEIVAGVVYFQSTRVIRDPVYSGIVSHELMHALGFGHTCSWRSVMTNELCTRLHASAPTPADVAHAQLLVRLRTLERQLAIHGTIRAALAARD